MSSTALVSTSSDRSNTVTTRTNQQSIVNQQKPATPVAKTGANQSPHSAQAKPSQHQLQQPTPDRSTPGKWSHPQMAEILQRQHRATFDTSNARRVVYSAVGLVSTVLVPSVVGTILPRAILNDVSPWLTWPMHVFQLILLLNITLAVMPLLRAKDNMEDIPLTPQQRQLLDLPPMSRPSTPQEQAAWVTPPRYLRNVTPNSMDSLLVNARGTPVSERESSGGGVMSSTPPSQYNGTNKRQSNISIYGNSPLARASPESGSSRRRRESSGTPRSSPLGGSESDTFGTPMMKSSRASVGLNSKWLYEKGKGSPVTAGFMSSGWGSGSVFT